ncbi:phage portal protein [Paenimyroides ceti]
MDLIELIKKDPLKALSEIETHKMKRDIFFTYELLRDEYERVCRNNRETQVGMVQKPKIVGGKTIDKVQLKVPFQNRIVENEVAFEIGEAPSLIPDKQNEFFDLIYKTWRKNRLHQKLVNALKQKKSVLESCIIFYIDAEESTGNWINRLFKNQKKVVKSKLNTLKDGKMYPVFNDQKDMIYFAWRFNSEVNLNIIDNIWIYDKTNVYVITNENGTYQLKDTKPHGFSRIPVVYLSQEEPSWKRVESLIDRYEVALSKLGESNDYTSHPLLLTYGEIQSLPDKSDEGKHINFPIKMLGDDEKTPVHGDAKFLTADNSAETSKLELQTIRELIYSMSSTIDASLENLKGLGDISGKALQILFQNPIIKAKMNEGDNRTMIERCLNIIADGIKKSIAPNIQTDDLLIDIQFNSILPTDLKEAIENAVSAVSGGVMSRKTAVNYLDMTDDAKKEIEDILSDLDSKQTNNDEKI